MMRFIIFPIIILLLSFATYAYVDVSYIFNVDNATVEAYDCLNSDCSQVGPFSGSFINGNTTNNGQMTIRFPSTLATQHGYALFYFAPGYAPKAFRATWHSFGDDAIYTTTFPIEFNKIENCKAIVSELAIVNEAQPNMPIVIGAFASLDATTSSAFERQQVPVSFFPQSYSNEYLGADTKVTLKIFDSKGLAHSESKILTILAGESERVEFSWLPTVPGQYLAEISSEVVDAQCNSNEISFSAASFQVFDNQPKNQCYTILSNLTIEPLTPKIGENIEIKFERISNFIDSNGALTPVPALVNLEIFGENFYFSNLLNLPASENPNTFSKHSYFFTPNQNGSFGIKLNGFANYNCPINSNFEIAMNFFVNPITNTDNPTDNQTNQTNLTENKYNVTFFIIDPNGKAIENVKIVLSNGQIAFTDFNGVAKFSLPSGTYGYLLEKEGYKSKNGKFEIIDKNLELSFVLLPLPLQNYEVAFIVRDKTNFAPIGGAGIKISDFILFTDSNGIAKINLPAGLYFFNVSAKNYKNQVGKFYLNSNTIIEISLEKISLEKLLKNFEKSKNKIKISIKTLEFVIGETNEFVIGIKNGLDDDLKVKLTIFSPDLNIFQSKEFKLEARKATTKIFKLEIPDDVDEGEQSIMISFSAEAKNKKFKKIIYRPIILTTLE